jgi:micrococcal nuclease
MTRRFNPAPGWPKPPEDWTPHPGWQPDPSWPRAPEGWQLWVDDHGWFRRHKVITGVGGGLAALLLIGAVAGDPQPEQSDARAASALSTALPRPPATPAPATSDAPTASVSTKPTATTTPAETPDATLAASAPSGVPDDVEPATVERVIDGDTIAVRAHAEGAVLEATAQITVRLLEVDTPETKHPSKGVECFGPEATSYTSKLVPVGSTVWVAPDRERTDRYGRDLLYAWAENGTFVNRQIIARGYGRVMLYEPNDRFIDEMRAAERAARAAGWGLWGACVDTPEPAAPKPAPAPDPKPETEPARSGGSGCDPSYPDVCIPPISVAGDLDCGDVEYASFRVLAPDPHGFDGYDNDGLGCESN